MKQDWRDDFQNEIPGEHLRDEPMNAHTSFRVGGPAAVLCTPSDDAAMCRALDWLARENTPFLIIGGGYNLLISDNGFAGAVLRAPAPGDPVVNGTRITAAASLPLYKLVRAAADNGLTGLENLAGIPGTVGGALHMNAGAFGACISDVLVGADVAAAGGVKNYSCDELDMSYRASMFQGRPDLAAVGAEFSLTPGDPAEIKKRIQEIMELRREKHPLNVPSAGSFFKNKRGGPASGILIEQAGLKGLAVGGAQVSPRHANFFVNTGGATCADILELMRRVQDEVERVHGARLEPEVRIIT